MSAYTEALPAVPIGGIKYRLDMPLHWRIGTKYGPLYTVPAGFVFDVSVPWWARWIFRPDDHRYMKAAALHDHMLINGWDRIVAAACLHQALTADQVPAWRRIVMWQVVSLYKYR